MFSSFVDGKVISRWADRDPLQQLFDNRLERGRLCDMGDDDSWNRPDRKCTTLPGRVTCMLNLSNLERCRSNDSVLK